MDLPFKLKQPQDWNTLSREFSDLCQVVAALRDPDRGCPWDLKQTFESLQKYLIEEAYESISAAISKNYKEYCEELGDVLLQVLLNSQLAFDAKLFSLEDVVKTLKEKLIRRHPHVFAEKDSRITSEGVEAQWEKIKQKEKKAEDQDVDVTKEKLKKLKGVFPANLRAAAIGKFSSEVNFDWKKPEEVFSQFQREVEELRIEFVSQERKLERVTDEISDVYFSLAQLCRHLKLNPEQVAEQGNAKFVSRFERMLAELESQKKFFTELDEVELEGLWARAKKTP